ncbi:beta-L-arabinofuranosidase domain-containing protein [Bacteroides cellulosilyticus]|jgi:hypothetical protein|uniref:beta-L-arabinofuranosidase domain-containing protein n=1 Tax=Bacteroides cellulosilyticus TaxID=246787 RepID=UPI0018ACFD52|nr:beta-L-arabinofuranosidase domain-containing protein [Bacteroides cellulosilyticus]
MKNYILKIALGLFISLSIFACQSQVNRQQSFSAFHEVPVSEITPKGWLEEWLIRQRDGLGLHRAESGHPYNTGMWTTVIPKRKELAASQYWWAYEQTAYMIDGLYRCGLLLKDSALISLGKENINYVISHPRADGRLGVDSLGDNQWALSIFARVLMTDYNETKNPQILQALTNHFLALPDSLTNRQTCIIESMCWTYKHTGDQHLLDRAQQIWKTYSIDEHPDNECFKHNQMVAGDSICVHGVTAAEVGKQPVSLYSITGNINYLNASIGFFEGVRKYHELVDGIPSSYEKLFGRHPEELHETCDISDFTWSYGNILLATGKTVWADRIEKAVFNAGMGAISKDFKAHQYFSAPNQLMATQYSSMADYGGGGKARQAYRPGFDTECCSGNVHRIIPNYASRLWMKDKNNGIVAAMYAPSILQTILSDHTQVSIEEITDYPFSDTILFRINPDEPISFPFTLRIPGWSHGTTIQINGEEIIMPESGTFFTIERQFKAGDEIKMIIPMEVKAEISEYDGISINRGPLLFALSIQEDVVKITDQAKTSANFPAYDIKPASTWNYALSKDVLKHIEIEEKECNGFPWDTGNSPVVLKMKASCVPEWQATVTTPGLPAKGFKVFQTENIEMVPFGSTRIRMCVFPIMN